MSYSETITRADLTNILNRILPAVQHTAIVGEIIQYAGSTAPIGWLMCDGSAVSRTTYAELFNVIGTTYGSGDGSTTFNVPDLRDNFAVGAGTTYELGDTGGEATVTLTTDGIPAHTHESKTLTGTISGRRQGNDYQSLWGTGICSTSAGASNVTSNGVGTSNKHADVVTINATHEHDSVGGGQAHENRPPYIALNYIIYAGVDDEGLIADDYIVEQGTSGIWTYRKWNSGVAECWGTDEKSTAVASAWGNNYTSAQLATSYPTGLFLSAPKVSVFSTGGYSSWAIASSVAQTKDTLTYSLVRPTSLSTGQTFYVNIIAIGKWK